MKRISTSTEARECEAVLVFLERKVTKERERLRELQERDVLNLVLNTLLCGSHPQGMLLLRGGERAKQLNCVIDSNATIRKGHVRYSVNSEGIPLGLLEAREKHGQITLELHGMHTAYLMEELSGTSADVVPGENRARVVLFTPLSVEQRQRYWIGTYGTLVSRQLKTCPCEEGEDTGSYDQHRWYINGPRKEVPIETKREWRALYAEKSRIDGLWYCKRTLALERGQLEELQ